MKKVSMIIICKNEEHARLIEDEMVNSHISQLGLMSWGVSIEDCTTVEEESIKSIFY